MAREIVIAWVGRHLREPWEQLCVDYRQRISHRVVVRDVQVKVRPGGDDARRQHDEGQALIAALPARCWMVAVDRRGKARSSPEMARWLARRRTEWPHPVALLIGSDLGLAEAVRGQARESISFGPMTLPHELARLVLYEQIYRALCIEAGIKYHRQPL